MDKRVLIAIPMLHEVKAEFMVSLLGLKLNGKNTEISVKIGSLVYEARNQLAMKALTEDFDYIMWFDSDMTFEPNTIEMLLEDCESGKDFVTGLCFSRAFPVRPVIAKSITYERNEKTGVVTHGAEIYTDYPRNSVFEIGGSGLACTMMRTSLLEEIASSFTVSPFYPMPQLGEDYSFCWRMARLGKKMWCDSRVKCGHIGSFCYSEKTWDEKNANA